MKVLVTGATGLLGKKLCQTLNEQGHSLVILSRNPRSAKTKLDLKAQYFEWQPEQSPPPVEALEGLDVIVHLAGESIASRRWSPSQKKRLYDSRVLATRNLVEGILRSQPSKNSLLISASAIGFYGDTGDKIVTEKSISGEGFLSELCVEWEKEALKLQSQMRVVLLRTGLVLSREGGVLSKLKRIFSFGAGGVLGDGSQWMSWIHDEDMTSIVAFIMHNKNILGPVNAVVPTPVTNQEFTRIFANVLRRPALLPVPKQALRLVFGEMSQIFLSSSRVSPAKLLELDYRFRFLDLKEALIDLLQ